MVLLSIAAGLDNQFPAETARHVQNDTRPVLVDRFCVVDREQWMSELAIVGRHHSGAVGYQRRTANRTLGPGRSLPFAQRGGAEALGS